MESNAVATPAFVFDIDALLDRVARLKSLFGKRFKLCYAIKANPFLTAELAEACELLEVCSPGEFRICERAHVPPERIVLSGVYKERSDIERIVGICGGGATYTAESPSQWELLENIAAACGRTLPVIARLSSGNQFGMDGATIERLFAGAEHITPVGIQLYSGTQKKPEKIKREAAELVEFAARLERKLGAELRRIEYGPGLPVSYFEGEPDIDEGRIADVIKNAFSDVPERTEIVIESGRAIAACCGEYVTTAVDVKRTDGVGYVIVDGGINHLNYYGQMMAMKLPRMRGTTEGGAAWTVCGSLCTTADVLARACPLGEPKIGDRLTFLDVGAYSVTEGLYMFLSRDMPRVYKRRGGRLELVRDVVRTDIFNGK